MAKERATYLSGMTGRIGNVVWRRYRDGYVTGKRPKKPEYTPSDAQLRQRERFKILVELARGFASAIEVGIRPVPQGMLGGRNIFMKRNKLNVHVTDDGAIEVNYSKLELSSGVLTAPSFKTPKTDTGMRVDVQYDAESDVPGTDDNDEVYILVYQPELKQGLISAAGRRSTGTVGVKVPALWSGTEVHIYGFAVGGGRLNRGICSNTVYLGKSTVE